MLEPCWICTEHEIETWCKDSAIDLAVSHSNQFQLPLNSQPLSASFQRNTLSFRLHRPLWDSAPFDRSSGINHVYNSSSIANGWMCFTVFRLDCKWLFPCKLMETVGRQWKQALKYTLCTLTVQAILTCLRPVFPLFTWESTHIYTTYLPLNLDTAIQQSDLTTTPLCSLWTPLMNKQFYRITEFHLSYISCPRQGTPPRFAVCLPAHGWHHLKRLASDHLISTKFQEPDWKTRAVSPLLGLEEIRPQVCLDLSIDHSWVQWCRTQTPNEFSSKWKISPYSSADKAF